MTIPGTFAARFGKVWHGARRIDHHDGSSSMALGFVVAEVNQDLEDRDSIALQLATAMNLTEQLDEVDIIIKDAQRLIDDLTRNISTISIPDYALLNEVPIKLNKLRGWLEITRRMPLGWSSNTAA